MLIVTTGLYVLTGVIWAISKVSPKKEKSLRSLCFKISNDAAYTIMVVITPSILTAFFIEIQEGTFSDWALIGARL